MSICNVQRDYVNISEGPAKCPTVPQRRELVTDTRYAGRGSKSVNEVICFFKCLNNCFKW